MSIIFALLTIALGAALVVSGYRLARFLIPFWGFVAGLSLGGAVMADIAGSSFLGTVLGVGVGIILGFVFAVFAYLYYTIAVLVLVGFLGYWIGSSFIQLLGFNPGLLSMLAGLMIGLLVGLGALFANAPKYVLILITSVAGAVATIGGVLLLFNQVPLDSFSYASVHASIAHSFIWTVIAVVLAVVGIVFQTESTRQLDAAGWDLPTAAKETADKAASQH